MELDMANGGWGKPELSDDDRAKFKQQCEQLLKQRKDTIEKGWRAEFYSEWPDNNPRKIEADNDYSTTYYQYQESSEQLAGDIFEYEKEIADDPEILKLIHQTAEITQVEPESDLGRAISLLPQAQEASREENYEKLEQQCRDLRSCDRTLQQKTNLAKHNKGLEGSSPQKIASDEALHMALQNFNHSLAELTDNVNTNSDAITEDQQSVDLLVNTLETCPYAHGSELSSYFEEKEEEEEEEKEKSSPFTPGSSSGR